MPRTSGWFDGLAAGSRQRWPAGWTIAAIMCLGLLSLLGAQVGMPQYLEVRARKFVLIDEAGNERAELATIPNGPQVRLVLRGKGKAAAYIGVGDDGMPLVALAGSKGEVVIELGILDDGPVVVLRDTKGRRRIGMTVAGDRRGGIVVSDADGRPIWQTPESK